MVKGRPLPTPVPVPDVMDWEYTGNRLHPTQKPIGILRPLIEAFCRPKGLVLHPFCGSGSTLVAAQRAGRTSVGIEPEAKHCRVAELRLNSPV